MAKEMLSQSDGATLLDLLRDQNGTIAAIWEAHQIMRDNADHLDNLKVFLKVREHQTSSEQQTTHNEPQRQPEIIEQVVEHKQQPPQPVIGGGMGGGFIKLQQTNDAEESSESSIQRENQSISPD